MQQGTALMGRAVPFDMTNNAAAINADAAVRIWLLVVAALVVVMITVGGATRLTGSGLSITEWKPIMGAIPPLDHAAWLEAFAKYKAIPQYVTINKGMSLEAFQFIFWWEWGHRFLGRIIGVAFALPLIWFWARGHLRAGYRLPLLALLVCGGMQGFIGWFMVQSGLSGRTDVSQYRLALHLGSAFLILGGLVWLALRLQKPKTALYAAPVRNQRQRQIAGVIVGLVFLQVLAGAFVAGLKAGLTYNTWPLMDGHLIPAGLATLAPWYLNVFENITTVQFNHRWLAYLVTLIVLGDAGSIMRNTEDVSMRRSAGALGAIVLFQVALGIWTLIAVAPLPLALMHQGGAVVLFAFAVRHLHLVRQSQHLAVSNPISRSPALA